MLVNLDAKSQVNLQCRNRILEPIDCTEPPQSWLSTMLKVQMFLSTLAQLLIRHNTRYLMLYLWFHRRRTYFTIENGSQAKNNWRGGDIGRGCGYFADATFQSTWFADISPIMYADEKDRIKSLSWIQALPQAHSTYSAFLSRISKMSEKGLRPEDSQSLTFYLRKTRSGSFIWDQALTSCRRLLVNILNVLIIRRYLTLQRRMGLM